MIVSLVPNVYPPWRAPAWEPGSAQSPGHARCRLRARPCAVPFINQTSPASPSTPATTPLACVELLLGRRASLPFRDFCQEQQNFDTLPRWGYTYQRSLCAEGGKVARSSATSRVLFGFRLIMSVRITARSIAQRAPIPPGLFDEQRLQGTLENDTNHPTITFFLSPAVLARRAFRRPVHVFTRRAASVYCELR